ncbi:uncharacterized protein LOC112450985 [Kryptolebias marmoratus]|uniref:uncharacterized protein LOC112450985 n=1 Tax=Kryptolebias marmoratus TaxID=37003 RepID=UPI0018ACAFF5|nr:uncharacterized protein LOC112450985 [Kryptolebias marmoratus]
MSTSEKILSSTQTTMKPLLNDTSEPQVHLSAAAVKACARFPALRDDKNCRNANSVTLRSADAGLGVPILSTSHPGVIDYPAELLNDTDDKRSRGMGITNLSRNAYLSGTMQSILQNDPAEDSERGNSVAGLCLTCLKDGKAASTEKSAALPAVSPHGSSNSLGREGLALDPNQFTTSLRHGEHKEIQSEEIRDRNTTSFSERGEQIYNLTFVPFPFNKTLNYSFLSNSQIKTSFSATEMVRFDTKTVAELSLATQPPQPKQQKNTYPKETFIAERLNLRTTTFDHLESRSAGGKPVKNRDQEVFSKKVSIWDPWSKVMHFTKSHLNASHSLSRNLKIQDISSMPVSNTPFIAKSPHESILSKGHAFSAASHPTARMNLIEVHGAITPFSLHRPTASAVRNLESQFLTARADSFISVLKRQTQSELSSQTKEPISTLLAKGSTIKLASLTEIYVPDKQDSQTFTSEHRIFKESFVNPPKMLMNTVMKEQQTSATATRKVVPVKEFTCRAKQDFGEETFGSTLVKHPVTALFKKLSETPSKIIQGKAFDNIHVSKSQQSLTTSNGNLEVDLHNSHNLKLEDNEEQKFTVVAKNENSNSFEFEGNPSREIQKTEEMSKLQDEEGSTADQIPANKKEEPLGLDKTESAELGKIINSGAEINQNPDSEAERMEEHTTKTSREEHVTQRRDKDPRRGEVGEERDAKRNGVTKINTENFTLDVAEMRMEATEEKGARAGRKEQFKREDVKCNKDIVKEDMTNVPLEHTTDWKELNKEHIVENLSSCHSLIKDLKTTKHQGIHLSESTSQKEGIANKSFSYKVTNNHQVSNLSLKSQRPKQSKQIYPTRTAMLLKRGATVASSQKKEVAFSVSATPKLSHTAAVSSSKFRDILKAYSSPLSRTAKSANMLSLITLPPATTTGFQRAQPHVTVNTSLSISIIHSIPHHRHKFNTSVWRVVHMANEREQAEYVTPSMNPARHQHMYNDSSTKPHAVTALSSATHISTGQSQQHQGQPFTQRSQSSSCPDATSGWPCSFKLSERTFHHNALHTPGDDNKQRFLQALMPPMSPGVEINQFPHRRMSPTLNVRLVGGDSLPVTYGLAASEEKTQRANLDADHANSGGESLLETVETNQSEDKDNVRLMVTSNIAHSNAVKNPLQSSYLITPITERSKQHAINTGELNSIIRTDGKDKENIAAMTPLLLANNPTGSTAFVELDGLLESPEIPTCDSSKTTFTEKQDNQHPSQETLNHSTVQVPHINNLTVHGKFTQKITDRIINVTSQVQIITAKTNYFVSVATTPSIGSTNVYTEDYGDSVPVTKKLSQAIAKHKALSKSPSKPLLLRGLLITSTPGKPTSAVTRTMETQSVQLPESKIFVQTTEQRQHALLAVTAITRPIKKAEMGVRAGFLKMAHSAGRAHGQTSAVVERMRYSSFKDFKSALTTKRVFEAKHPPVGEMFPAHTQEHMKHTSPGKTSISQAIIGAMTDSVPPAGISPTEVINKTSCRTIGYAKSGGTAKTSGAGVMDHTGEMYEVHSAFTERSLFAADSAADTKPENDNWSSDRSVPGKATPQAINLKVVLSPVTRKSEHGRASADGTGLKKDKSTSDKPVHLEKHSTPQWAQSVMKTTRRRFHRETSRALKAAVREATLLEAEAATAQTRLKSTEQTLFTERNTRTQLDRSAGKARMFKVQNASRSLHAHAKEETARPESGSRLLLSEPKSKSELPRLNQRRRTSPHLYLPGVAEVSDDLCGSGNYTAEMSLKLGRSLEPGDAVPAGGNLRVFINLKTNNSQINLGVTSCCLSPTSQPDFSNFTCCLFSRLRAKPSGITLLPSALSTSASFTISLFQMINYSVVYLHCDLSVCLRNHSDCERCFQERSAVPSDGPETAVANLKNRISFGPVLKQAKNSTFPKEIDLSELDLVLVIISLAVGFSLITMMLLLVWLAYRHRAIWLLRSAAPPQACCGCLRPGGDLISP